MNQFEETLSTLIVFKSGIAQIKNCLDQINTFHRKRPTVLDLAIDYELPNNIIGEMIRKGASLTPERALIGQNIPILLMLCDAGLIKDQLIVKGDGSGKGYESWSKFAFAQVKFSMIQYCIALQDLELDANRLMKIVFYACLPFSAYVPKHTMWQLITSVKHFSRE